MTASPSRRPNIVEVPNNAPPRWVNRQKSCCGVTAGGRQRTIARGCSCCRAGPSRPGARQRLSDRSEDVGRLDGEDHGLTVHHCRLRLRNPPDVWLPCTALDRCPSTCFRRWRRLAQDRLMPAISSTGPAGGRSARDLQQLAMLRPAPALPSACTWRPRGAACSHCRAGPLRTRAPSGSCRSS